MAETLIPAWEGGVLLPLEKIVVHRRGLRHKAVSVFVFQGRKLLLQKRAAGKYHSAGLWANSCCTHPFWGESDASCAERRLRQELGISGLALHPAGRVGYRADVGAGMIEDEDVAVFTAEAPPGMATDPDPTEVAALRWVDLTDLAEELGATPERFTAWLRIYLDRHRSQILGART
ncbi:MAG: isopentenyl-diphosphate Delta-isomerase [Pseudorhodobacter sp.]